MRKRLLALGLFLVLCMTMAAPAFAKETEIVAESEYTFIDSDGKENTLVLNAYEDGTIITNIISTERGLARQRVVMMRPRKQLILSVKQQYALLSVWRFRLMIS